MPQVKTLYEQVDPPNPALRRESAELYFKENVPPLIFSQAFEVGSYILGCSVSDPDQHGSALNLSP